MLTSEIVTQIRDHGFDDLLDTRLLGFVNDKYWEICGLEPWPFLEKSASLTLTGGQVTAPTDIDKVLSIVDTAAGRALYPRRLDNFTETYPDALGDTGDALYYYFIGPNLHIYPNPGDGTGTLVCRYISTPSALTISPDSTPVLPVQYHYVIVLGALTRAYAMEDDPENVALFTQQYEKAKMDMRNNLLYRQFQEPDSIIDVFAWDDMDWAY